ncbi:MAG: hypothetical protein GC189_12595 [Alphaproteobacteria bacterium]|nr:hypothetical protein [Alphaproteobacteria bacterium]
MSPMSMALEGVLALLLAACLFYCWRLDQKLSALRNGQDGIRAAAAELNLAVTQANDAVKALRLTSAEAGRALQDRIDDARILSERLGARAAAPEPTRAGRR